MLKPVFPAALVAFLLIAASASASSSSNLLINGDFETGDTSGWSYLSDDGDLAITSSSRSGFWAATLASDGQANVVKTWQTVPVQPLATYYLSGWALLDDPDLRVFYFRIDFLTAAGNPLGEYRSNEIEVLGASYQLAQIPNPAVAVSAGVTAPEQASSARIQAIAQGHDIAPFSVSIDDIAFQEVSPAPPTPSPAPSVGPTPAPTGTPTTGSATPPPTRTPSPSATSSPALVSEPAFFSELTNGGFEQSGAKGVFGWHKIGGTLTQSTNPRTGEYSAALASSTSSTKWIYQTVAVQGGQYYQAAAYARQDNELPGEIFLRLSWYTSVDGSGAAISNDDDSSGQISGNSASFELIETDSHKAPAEARSVRVRLMFRPADDGLAVAYYDDVTFGLAASPLTAREGTSPLVNAASIGGSSVLGSVAAPSTNDGEAIAGAVYNAGRDAGGEAQPVHQSSNSSSDWLLALSIALPVAAIGGVLSIPYLRRRLGERAA